MYNESNYIRQLPMLNAGESIIWHGKPKRGVFILTKSLTLMPFALIWLGFDLAIMVPMFSSGEMLTFIIPFFALHLMPVWIWLGNILTAGRRWKNTTYFVTNRRIIIQGGFLAVNETSLFYKDIRNAQMRIGLLDKLCHTADIYFDDGFHVNMYGSNSHNRHSRGFVFEDLDNAQAVYGMVQRVIMDMQTDIEYPNSYRPADNPGYQTDYRYK